MQVPLTSIVMGFRLVHQILGGWCATASNVYLAQRVLRTERLNIAQLASGNKTYIEFRLPRNEVLWVLAELHTRLGRWVF